MLFLLTDSPQKLKSENIHDTLIILLYVSPRSLQLQRHFLLKHAQKGKQVQLQWIPAFKSESCRLRFSQLLLCYKLNLPISNVNYVDKEY